VSTSIRPVPALKLARSNSAWFGDPLGALNSGVDGGVVIPLRHRREADDLLIQQLVRVSGGAHGLAVPNPVWVIFARRDNAQVMLGAGPALNFSGAGTGYGQRTPLAPDARQWLSWSVRWDQHALTSWYSSSRDAQAQAFFQNGTWHDHPVIEGIVIAATEADCMIAELRLWEGRSCVRDGLGELLDRRLDGREPGLIGYWKFDEGTGNEIRDSSRFRRNARLKGGQWVAAKDTGLTLDCALEDVERLRKEARDLRGRSEAMQKEIDALAQKKGPLEAHIAELKARKAQMAVELEMNLEALDAEIAKAKSDHVRWREDMEKLGAVTLDHFSEEVAREIHGAVERLDQGNNPYRLQRVAVEVKVLPVHAEDKAGADDYRVMFPEADTQVDPQQLTTLRFGFEVRPQAVKPRSIRVPDVRGYTELAAARKLRETGLRMVTMEQATDELDKIGRVVAQIVEEESDNERVVTQISSNDVKVKADSLVTVFLGRASDGGARGMTAGLNEPRS
jgi:hypothetical protein